MDNNFFKGHLKRWNDDKGFGFINVENDKKDIFIHISALKKMNRRPVAGDVIFFQIHTNNDGKNRAVNARIEGVASVKPRVKRKSVKTHKNNWFSKLFFPALLITVGFVFYKKVIEGQNLSAITSPPIISFPKQEEYRVNYSCNGKTYCSEMTSCEEATFYQRNCPGTKMDGDGDGVPCERQWCSW